MMSLYLRYNYYLRYKRQYIIMAGNEVVKSKRQKLTERMQTRYPDIDFNDDEQLFGRISDDYDQHDQEIAGYKEREGKFSDMFTSDPRSARLMMSWKDGDDPAVALVRLYGTDIAEAINDPEKQDEIAEANKEYMERVTQEKEYEKQYSLNLAQSLGTLEKMQEEMGLDDDQIDSAMEWIITIAKDAMLGKFTPEIVRMAINAQNYENDLERATQEGEVRGRNAKIEERLRKSYKGDGTANLDGKNRGQRVNRSSTDLGAIERFGDGNMTIFERGGEKRRPIKR